MGALFAIILIAYIGLGIPDSLLGAAWPAIYGDLDLPVSYASFITSVTYLGTIISSFMSGRVIKLLGTAKVTVISTVLTAVALLGFSFSDNMLWFCAAAFPLGLGAGSIDTALNNYVALNYKASHISFLHCFYGVGVTLSPYLISLILRGENGWREGYRIIFAVQASIAVVLLISMPLWKKAGQVRKDEEGQSEMKVLSIRSALALKKAKSSIFVMMSSCAIESICLVWASTYLAEARGMSAQKAAGIVTVYFIGMTVGRFISGLTATKISSKRIIVLTSFVTFAGIIILLTGLPLPSVYAGLFFIGLGNGPLFPNMTHLIPKLFGEAASQSMIGIEMGFCSVSILVSPLLFGAFSDKAGTKIFPIYLLLMFVVMIVSEAFLFGKSKKDDK